MCSISTVVDAFTGCQPSLQRAKDISTSPSTSVVTIWANSPEVCIASPQRLEGDVCISKFRAFSISVIFSATTASFFKAIRRALKSCTLQA